MAEGRTRATLCALAELLLYLLIFAAFAVLFDLRPARGTSNAPAPSLACEAYQRPRIQCSSRSIFGSVPVWRVACPGEKEGGRVCDVERGITVYPTIPEGDGWVWLTMSWRGGSLAVEARWDGERAQFRARR